MHSSSRDSSFALHLVNPREDLCGEAGGRIFNCGFAAIHQDIDPSPWLGEHTQATLPTYAMCHKVCGRATGAKGEWDGVRCIVNVLDSRPDGCNKDSRDPPQPLTANKLGRAEGCTNNVPMAQITFETCEEACKKEDTCGGFRVLSDAAFKSCAIFPSAPSNLHLRCMWYPDARMLYAESVSDAPSDKGILFTMSFNLYAESLT